MPTSAKTGLCRKKWQDVTYVRAAPRGRPLQLPLFLHKGLVLSPARLKFAPPGPTLLQKTIQELVKKLERSHVIPINHNCRVEAAQTLIYDGSRSNGWQDTIHKVFIINSKGPRMIRHNVLFLLFHRGQWWHLPVFLQQAVDKSGQFCKCVVSLICCSGGVMITVGNWNRNMYHRQGNTDYHHPCPAMMQKSTRKQTWNHDGTILVCS